MANPNHERRTGRSLRSALTTTCRDCGADFESYGDLLNHRPCARFTR